MKLGELIDKAKIKRCGTDEYPVLSMTMHDGIVEQRNRFKKAIASKDTSSYKVVNPGQLVVGFPIDEGVIYVQKHPFPGIMSPAYNIWDIDTGKVDSSYLELALHGPRSMAYYADKMRGTTARRRSITADSLCALEIPLPSLSVQREVVALFRRVKKAEFDGALMKEKLDSLVKSRFVEMFGDPTVPDGSWPVSRLDGFTKIITGNTPSRKHAEYYGDGIEWVKTDNIVDSAITIASERLSEIGRSKARVAPMGSILMACIAGSVKSIGKVGLLDREAAFNQQINAIVPTDVVDSRYLLAMFTLSKNYLCSDVNQQLKGILNKSSLSSKQFPLPPLALQQEFASFVAEVDKSRFVARQSAGKYNDALAAIEGLITR